MSSTLIDSIFAESDFSSEDRDLYSFIQIQYYDVGDYIVPHSDLYAITKLHLVVLTDSICDGFCGVVDGCVYKVQDQAGTYIDFDSSCVHWVGPVCNKRWSLVIGV